jgi:hypothetical protein
VAGKTGKAGKAGKTDKVGKAGKTDKAGKADHGRSEPGEDSAAASAVFGGCHILGIGGHQHPVSVRL